MRNHAHVLHVNPQMDESPPWRIHDAGGINLEGKIFFYPNLPFLLIALVKCPTHRDRLVIVPMVNMKKIMIPGTEIICSCCDRLVDDNGVTQVFANSWYALFRIIVNLLQFHFTN